MAGAQLNTRYSSGTTNAAWSEVDLAMHEPA